MKRLIVFDLDGTLAESKSAIDPEMAELLGALLAVMQVAIISGGDWPQFQEQLLSRLAPGEHLEKLSVLPTCESKFYRYQSSSWTRLYSEDFTEGEKKRIIRALEEATAASGVNIRETRGEQIEDRGGQITFSALGQQALLEDKKRWDPDFAKRAGIKAVLDKLIPEFSVRLGGATSIDVTRQGIDKAYGMNKLRDALDIALDQMLFVGDALFPGGNDHPVRALGVVSIQVRDPTETKRVIEAVTACVGGAANR